MISDRNTFFIDNTWVKPASNRIIPVFNASTGEEVAKVPEGVNADIDLAVTAARKAFDNGEWPRMKPAQRAELMEKFIAALAARKEDLTIAVSTQNGMPISLSQQLEGDFSLSVMDYYSELTASSAEPEIRPSQLGQKTIVERNPVGVVAAIIPWNFPVALAVSKIAPALAVGCTMVIKPSPETVLDSYILAEAALEAGIPAGVLNWVPAEREAGAYLVAHPGVDKVAFTGSTGAGRKIAAKCGELLRPVTLELGGKSAAIFLDDAKIETFLEGIPMACILNNGQTCYNGTRILAPKTRYNEVVEAVSALVSGLTVGHALDPATHIGPMASSNHRTRVENYIETGKAEARLVSGGTRLKTNLGGWFVEPTVFADVSNDAVIAQEEIFGPVLSIISYTNDEDAIKIANDSEYGLGGSIWSSDSEHAQSMAQNIHSGTVGINGYMPAIGSPFGGVKASGIGSEFGPEALANYQQMKSTYIMA